MKQASVSSTDQGGGKLRSDTPTDFQEALASHSFAAFLQRVKGLVRLRGFSRSIGSEYDPVAAAAEPLSLQLGWEGRQDGSRKTRRLLVERCGPPAEPSD